MKLHSLLLFSGNMTGKIKGVGPRIQRLYPKALHFWCASHLLNRCIVAACDLQQVRNMMSTADKVIYPNVLSNITLKYQYYRRAVD